jgi:hypothetical protein
MREAISSTNLPPSRREVMPQRSLPTSPNRRPARTTRSKTASAKRPKTVQFGEIDYNAGHRVVLYGPGGIGKTTMASQAPGAVAFIDLDDSLPRLRSVQTDIAGNIRPVAGVESWLDLRDVLQTDGWDEIATIVIDSLTKAEELAVAHTLTHVPHDKGHRIQRIEDYGFGKGYQHVFDIFLPLLADLDRHCRAGRHVVLICHDCTSTVPNPAGEDWLRYEPRLQSPSSGKASIRLRAREWADHVLFMGYDIDVSESGKGRGAGTRTLYPAELPHCMAKSRTCVESMAVEGGASGDEVWERIIKRTEQ